MMKAFFQDKFEYTSFTNNQFIALLLGTPEIYAERISLLSSHILNAHHIWNHRILSIPPHFSVWQQLPLEELQNINLINSNDSLEILHQTHLDQSIIYKNSQGQSFTNSVAEIYFHIINHSTYHRGQVMSLLKTNGVEPIATDYIFYKR